MHLAMMEICASSYRSIYNVAEWFWGGADMGLYAEMPRIASESLCPFCGRVALCYVVAFHGGIPNASVPGFWSFL